MATVTSLLPQGLPHHSPHHSTPLYKENEDEDKETAEMDTSDEEDISIVYDGDGEEAEEENDDNAPCPVRRLVHQDSKRLVAGSVKHTYSLDDSSADEDEYVDAQEEEEEDGSSEENGTDYGYEDADVVCTSQVRPINHRDSLQMMHTSQDQGRQAVGPRRNSIESANDVAGHIGTVFKKSSRENDEVEENTTQDTSDDASTSTEGDAHTDRPVPVRRLVHRDSKRLLSESLHKKRENEDFLAQLQAELDDEYGSDDDLLPHVADPNRRRMCFGISPFPNTSHGRLTGKGLDARSRRLTSQLTFNEEIEYEHIDNFSLELTKREKRSVWFTDKEMIMIQIEFLDEQQEMQRRKRQKERERKKQNNGNNVESIMKKDKKKKKHHQKQSDNSKNVVDRRREHQDDEKKKKKGGRFSLMKKAKSISNIFSSSSSSDKSSSGNTRKPRADDIDVSRCGDRRNNFHRSNSCTF